MFQQQINDQLMSILGSKMESHVTILCLGFNICSGFQQQSRQLVMAVHARDMQRRESTLKTRTEKDEVNQQVCTEMTGKYRD